MTLNKNHTDLETKTEEAEERNAREAKQVEAPDFHSGRVGSSPIASTDCFFKKVSFTIAIINGREYSRLSVLPRI